MAYCGCLGPLPARSAISVDGDDGLMKPLEPPKLQVLIRDPDSGKLRMPEALGYTHRNHETIKDRYLDLLEGLEQYLQYPIESAVAVVAVATVTPEHGGPSSIPKKVQASGASK